MRLPSSQRIVELGDRQELHDSTAEGLSSPPKYAYRGVRLFEHAAIAACAGMQAADITRALWAYATCEQPMYEPIDPFTAALARVSHELSTQEVAANLASLARIHPPSLGSFRDVLVDMTQRHAGSMSPEELVSSLQAASHLNLPLHSVREVLQQAVSHAADAWQWQDALAALQALQSLQLSPGQASMPLMRAAVRVAEHCEVETFTAVSRCVEWLRGQRSLGSDGVGDESENLLAEQAQEALSLSKRAQGA
jgi:hypothetical protein